MSKSISFRLRDELIEPITRWLELNNMDLSTLCNLAIQKLITSEPILSKVKLESADDEAALATAAELIEAHSDALDRLNDKNRE